MQHLLKEKRAFTVCQHFAKQANLQGPQIRDDADRDYLGYWERQAEHLHWFNRWSQVLDWKPPYAAWFVEGSMNISYNCLDRHMPALQDKVAFYWENEQGSQRTVTYGWLYQQVQRCANVLKKLGVKKGDRVALYMPMIPEAVVAMLACARIGAIHTVVFAGFSAQALADRIRDAACSLVITADATYRKGSHVPLKAQVDESLTYAGDTVKQVLVMHNVSVDCAMQSGRDVWYHEISALVDDVCPAEPMDAEDISFILYTSGTTGKPKGIVHTTGGYAVGAYTTMQMVFDAKKSDIFWCTADIGWITGHTYVAYGPLLHGLTQVMYEGSLSDPHKGRVWELIEKYSVTIFYTAPTAIRMFCKWGDALPAAYTMSSLRLLGSVGEPLNPEAWIWYYTQIGKERCPIVDTWWQTETGSHMISTLPGIDTMRPGYAGKALPGVQIALVNDHQRPIQQGAGLLTITRPWPSMLRTIWNDDERYVSTYFRAPRFDSYYTGDAASYDEHGNIMIIGRVDDVLNVSGHRIGTMEIESALVNHSAVAEVAVVPKPHDIKGQAIVAFVILKEGHQPEESLKQVLKQHVVTVIGAIARPDEIIFTPDVPKTRSGKIMRRLLRELVHRVPLSDMTTLANQEVIAALKQYYQSDCS